MFGGSHETSPPSLSASGSGRCRGPGCLAACRGANLSNPANCPGGADRGSPPRARRRGDRIAGRLLRYMSHLFGTERTYRAKLATSAFAAARRDHTRRPAQGDGDESDDALLRMPFKDARAAAIDGFEERGRGSCDRCPRGARLSTHCVVCARAGGAPGQLAALDRFSRRRLRSCPSVSQGKVKMLATWRSIAKCSGSNLPPIREDRSTLPIENQSFVNSGEGGLSLHFLFQDLTQYQE